MSTRPDTNILFQLVVSPDPRYRVTRHFILWTTTVTGICRGFAFLARNSVDPSANYAYIALSTLFFGGLTIGGYIAVTRLTQQFVLLRFRVGLFIGGLLVIHVLTAELVLGHFFLFTSLFTFAQLPRFYTIYSDHINQLPFWQAPFDSIIVFFFSFSLFYNYLLYAIGIKVFKDLFTGRLRQAELEKENLQLEFNFLKAQVNPHFLFNTLNNIYSFSLKSPAKVSDTILKLADLMRYSLYETEEEFVPLGKELSFLDSYVQLERIRHDPDVQITYAIQGQPGALMIPPLILIVFVENAFKHGVQASAQASWVRTELVIDHYQLTFRVTNSLPTNPIQSIGGIGIKNVRKRLEHFFPGQYQLHLDKQSSTFSAHLILTLHEPAVSGRHR